MPARLGSAALERDDGGTIPAACKKGRTEAALELSESVLWNAGTVCLGIIAARASSVLEGSPRGWALCSAGPAPA